MTKRTRRCVDCKADISDRGNAAQRCKACVERQAQARRKLQQPRTCEGCGEQYHPRGHKQKWCKSCVWNAASRVRMVKYGFADLARYKADLASGTRTSTCETCSEQFTYRYTGGIDRRYCDADASRQVVAGRAGQSRRGSRPLSELRSCVVCSSGFYPTHPQQKYCMGCAGTKSERARAYRYGTSKHDVERLKARFAGRCWICRTKQGTCVDHDHDTGRVRGWLCRPCNGALHYLERPDWVSSATAYLREAPGDDYPPVPLGDGSTAL